MSADRRKILIRTAIFCMIALALLLGWLKYIDESQKEQYPEERSEGTAEFMQSGAVEYQGDRYRKTPAVTTLLIGGIDHGASVSEGVSTSRYRNGGQADFLLLLAIDHTNQQIHQLQIDRDAMAEATVLSVYGRETGTRVMQICLAHSYGANKAENARYTQRAVQNLLGGEIQITGYYMVDYSAVSVLNDLLDGVTVVVPDDMTSVDPAWTLGSTVTLTGSQAETFVRARKSVGEGTNLERMGRQSEFMQKAIIRLREKLSADTGFGAQVLTALKKNAAASLSDQELLEEVYSSLRYTVLPVEYLAGEYRIGESGYMEFYPAENSAHDWIMRHLYTKE